MLSVYKRVAIAAVFCSAGVLWNSPAAASDLADALPATPAAEETAPLPAAEPEVETEVPTDAAIEAEVESETEAEPLVCPPGQFASTFADVYPFHWAYDAVNELAAPPMQCFDWPEEYL
ncbi:MAG: hypothetical protein ACFB0G_23035 [Leptolyngbyaceae cyanobacterium]